MWWHFGVKGKADPATLEQQDNFIKGEAATHDVLLSSALEFFIC